MNDYERIKQIEERMEWMCENLKGCDWCCGGGDREMDELRDELAELLGVDRLELDESGL